MFSGNFKMALAALRASKWRSLLTMIGVIIGVVSVVTTVSLGEGIKHQIVGQINRLGADLITIRPGKLVQRDKAGRITKVNVLAGYNFASGSLPANDLSTIAHTPGVKLAVPIGLITAGVKVGSNDFNEGAIIGTSAGLPTAIRQRVEYGAFFSDNESTTPVAVIGHNVAYKLFQEEAPVGMTLSIHGQDFVVRGVFSSFDASPLALGPDFNNAIFIPYDMARQLTGGNVQLVQVLALPRSSSIADSTIKELNVRLSNAHGQQEDFTVLSQDENLIVTVDVLNALTGFIASIAAISLIVSGIGIMNIMLVSVTERTREIGIRKAIGATSQQIMGQFLIEALVLSCAGAAIGFVLALLIIVALRVATHLQPAITWPIVAAACLISVAVGVVFGLMPAAKAARKDPIDALRYE